jgi:hypothetical protein
MVVETQKIAVGDIVRHKSKDDEMLVLSISKRWVTCEYADSEGERVEKVYDKDFLVFVEKKPIMKINPNVLNDIWK